MKLTKDSFRKKMTIKVFLVIIVLVFFSTSPVWSAIKVSSIPLPPPTAKLRIYVVAVTSSFPAKKGFWPVSPEEFAARMATQTDKMLRNQGIYEVVSAADVTAVLGPQDIAGWEWLRNDWELAKNAGRALHADYILCIERSWKINFQMDMTLFNLNTGRKFYVSNYLPPRWIKENANIEMIRINYRTLFREAKSDLMHTALSKGRLFPADMKEVRSNKEVKEAALIHQKAAEPSPSVTLPADDSRTAKEKQLAFEKEIEDALSGKNKKQNGSRLVVYDFDTAERLRVVGLILTEALREELYKMGGFVLVNRENMAQVIDELKLQQSGMVNEKQAVKLGEWMAANEAVTGNFASLGSSSVLQAKRFDIKTLGTIALGSLKCKAGEEDELLNNMPVLARKLTELQKK